MKIIDKQFHNWKRALRNRNQSKPIVVTEHYVFELGEKIIERSSIEQWKVRMVRLDGRVFAKLELKLQNCDWVHFVFHDTATANKVVDCLK